MSSSSISSRLGQLRVPKSSTRGYQQKGTRSTEVWSPLAGYLESGDRYEFAEVRSRKLARDSRRSRVYPVLIGRTSKRGPGLLRSGPLLLVILRAAIATSLRKSLHANSQGTRGAAASPQSSSGAAGLRSRVSFAPAGEKLPCFALRQRKAKLVGADCVAGSAQSSCHSLLRAVIATSLRPPQNASSQRTGALNRLKSRAITSVGSHPTRSLPAFGLGKLQGTLRRPESSQSAQSSRVNQI